jgi:hypothetical protein
LVSALCQAPARTPSPRDQPTPRSASTPGIVRTPTPRPPSPPAQSSSSSFSDARAPRSLRGTFSASPPAAQTSPSMGAARSDMIRLCLRATMVSETLYREGRRVVLKISVPVTRRREFPYSLVVQVIDVSREDTCSSNAGGPARKDASGKRSWLPLYRSESQRDPKTDDGSLAFQEIVLPEWRLGSADL